MATPEDIMDGLAAAMENEVPDLTTALSRQADRADNMVEWPHGDMTIISNNRLDNMNSDFVGYATDDMGNRIGKILESKHDLRLQLNIWTAVPSEDWDIQALGKQLEKGMKRYDENRDDPEQLPDGSGGKLEDYSNFGVADGGQLPSEDGQNPPIRGYMVAVTLRYTTRINTAEEYGAEDYVETIDIGDDIESDGKQLTRDSNT